MGGCGCTSCAAGGGCGGAKASPQDAAYARQRQAVQAQKERELSQAEVASYLDKRFGFRGSKTSKKENNTMRDDMYQEAIRANNRGVRIGAGEEQFNATTLAQGCVPTGDMALAFMQDPDGFRWHESQRDTLAPLYTNAGVIGLAYDYSCLGPKAVARAASDLMHGGGGIYAVDTYASTTTLTTASAVLDPSTITGVGDSLALLGIVIDWGIALANYAPFDATLETQGFLSVLDGTDTDRNMKLRFTGGVLGGRMYVPLAYRSSNGMNYGQNVLSRLRKNGEIWDTATISVSNLPTPIAPNFGFSVQPICAFTPQFAEYTRVTGLAAGSR